MLRHINITNLFLRLAMIVGFVFTPMISIRTSVSAQGNLAPAWVVRSLNTNEFGVNDPKGLTYSSTANTFFVLDGTTNITLITMFEENAGTRNVSDAQVNPTNTAFDNSSNSLFVFDQGKSELAKGKADSKGLPDPQGESKKFNLKSLNVKDAHGITFDSNSDQLFILDAGNSQVISIAPHPTLGFDANEAINSKKVQRLSLNHLKARQLNGLAYNPGNGHLYVTDPSQKKLFELKQDGNVVSIFDLATLGINNPTAITFAPSVDNTDDPNKYDLFLLDSGQPQQAAKTQSLASAVAPQTIPSVNGQIVELSLVAPQSLPAGTTLLPATLVHTIDTSVWSNPSTDPSGIDYWPLTGKLMIDDSEVEEAVNGNPPVYWHGFNIFQSTLDGNLTGNCTTFTSNPTSNVYNNFTNEPSGLAINSNNNHFFFSSDGLNSRLHEVGPGPDGTYCTPDDTVTKTQVSTLYGLSDSEDVAYGNNTVFVADGVNAEVYVIPLGADGVLGGGNDGPVTHFDTSVLGFNDLEGICYNPDAGTLFIVSTQGTENYLGEVTPSGTLVHAYDLSFMGTTPNIRSDVAYAPGSQNSGVKNIYIVSRGIDNNTDRFANDGKVWEVNISGSSSPTNTPTLGPSPTPTNTPTPGATFTPTSTPTPSNTPTATNTPSVSDLIFADSFESGNLSAWTSNSTGGGDLNVNAAAALVGGQGMQAVINDNTALYVTDDTPSAEPRYRVRFYFDPNSVVMGNKDAHFIFRAFAGTSTVVLQMEFRFSSGAYQIRARALNDSGTWISSNWFTISDASHFIEFDWRAATSAGANNGSLTLWIDGTQQTNLTGMDNDTQRIDSARLGAVTGIDTSTRGNTYFDAFESRRQSYIGP